MKNYLTIVILIIGTFVANAQQGIVSSGGNASGTGGSVSFSIGLIDYVNVSNGIHTITQGIQQPFEFYTTKIKRIENNFNINTFPNPSTGLLIIEIGNFDHQQLSFEIFDLQGKKLMEEKITNTNTEINIQNIFSGFYLINIKDENNQIIQTIKIIKH